MNEYPMKLLHSKYLKKIGKLSIIATSIICVFIIIFYQYDHTHFNGFDEKEDADNTQKVLNRLYFTMTTFSSTGYGDVSPNSMQVKIITMILQFILVIAMLGGILEF